MSAKYSPTPPEATPGAWQQFWFQPRDPWILSVLRIIAGISSVYFFLSYTTELVNYFGATGVLDQQTLTRVVTNFGSESVYRISILQLSSDASFLYTIHVISILIALAMTAGFFSRVTTPLTFLMVLSYVHRGPMITGQFEPVLTMILAYLSLGPTGAYLSLDGWRRNQLRPVQPSVMANISWRLIQVHLAALYILIGLSMLSGEVWWLGEALLWLSASPDSRMIDISTLNTPGWLYLVNFWTHAMVAFMLLYGVFIWKRPMQKILVYVSLPIWLLIALLTGLISYCALMAMLNVAFWVPPTPAVMKS